MDILPQDTPENNPTKKCNGCKSSYPCTLEFFYGDKSRKDGLCTICKVCQRAKYVARRSPLVRVRVEVPQGMKLCSKCEQVFPATTEHFQHDRNRKDGWYSYCKNCIAQQRQMPQERAKKLAYNTAYYGKKENHERILTQRKDNYRNKPEVKQKALDRNKLPEVQEYNKAYLKKYNKTPEAKAKNRANKHTYRARSKSVSGTHTAKQIQDLLRRQKYKCYYCSRKFEKKDGKYVYQVEHTFPISRVAGTNIPANDISYLVLACHPCNRDKGNKFPWEFPEGGRLL